MSKRFHQNCPFGLSPPKNEVDTLQYWDEKIETMKRDELEAFQLKHLKHILNHAYNNSEHYRNSFEDAGVSPMTLIVFLIFKNFQLFKKIILGRIKN